MLQYTDVKRGFIMSMWILKPRVTVEAMDSMMIGIIGKDWTRNYWISTNTGLEDEGRSRIKKKGRRPRYISTTGD